MTTGRYRTAKRTWAVLALTALGLAACGSDGADTLDGVTTTTVAPTTQAPATSAASSSTEAAGTTDATEDTAATEDTNATDATDATGDTGATEDTNATEDTDATEDTAATEDTDTGDSTVATSTTAAPTSTTAAEQLALDVVPVALREYAIDLPATLPAGPTKFTALNGGAVEHHMTILKYADGQDLGDVLTLLSTDPAGGIESASLFAGPQGVAPGAAQSATTNLEPGGYLALCVIPDADGIPHAAKGMLKEFTVTGPEDEAPAVPAADGIVLKDYGFTLPDDFTGDGLYRVENQGTKPHELAIYRVADGSTFQDAEEFLAGGSSDGTPPVVPSGGLTPITAGTVGGTELHLTTGTYVFVCFLPGTDHLTHLQHGMIREVEIE